LDFLAIIGIGVAAFAATDIDDLFVLMLFFSYPTYKAPQVITGQYLGIGVLVSVGIVGSLIALVVPATIVRLMGLLPITMALRSFSTCANMKIMKCRRICRVIEAHTCAF
jgi:cadmium resistance protein CadD (predicted permease)